MFVLFAVFSRDGRFRRTLEMDGESVTADARIKTLILEIEREAKLVTVVANGAIKIIDEKLRGDTGKTRSLMNCHRGHNITSWPAIFPAGLALKSTTLRTPRHRLAKADNRIRPFSPACPLRRSRQACPQLLPD